MITPNIFYMKLYHIIDIFYFFVTICIIYNKINFYKVRLFGCISIMVKYISIFIEGDYFEILCNLL